MLNWPCPGRPAVGPVRPTDPGEFTTKTEGHDTGICPVKARMTRCRCCPFSEPPVLCPRFRCTSRTPYVDSGTCFSLAVHAVPLTGVVTLYRPQAGVPAAAMNVVIQPKDPGRRSVRAERAPRPRVRSFHRRHRVPRRARRSRFRQTRKPPSSRQPQVRIARASRRHWWPAATRRQRFRGRRGAHGRCAGRAVGSGQRPAVGSAVPVGPASGMALTPMICAATA